MPDSLVRVEEEWQCKEAFDSDLDSGRPCSDGGDHRLRLEMPASVWRCEVGESPQVEGSGNDDGGQTVKARGVPGDLRLVDGQMRGDGAVDTLLDEDFMGFGLGRCESMCAVSICLLLVEMLAMPSYLRCTKLRPAG